MPDNKRIPVLIDCDTGGDDAIALVLACACKTFDILGVTTVSGNVDVENTTQNTLNVLHHIGRGDIPVAKGAAAPLQRPALKASAVHGLNGLRGWSFEQNQTAALTPQPAWDFMRDKLEAAAEKVTVLALGPVTNLAILLEKYPECRSKIDKVVFMGTSYHDGNPTPVATFNVLVDPEAFRKLLFSGVELYACPLETTRKGHITNEEIESIRDIPGPVAAMCYGIFSGYGNPTKEEIALLATMEGEEDVADYRMARPKPTKREVHDAATVAFVSNPELFGWHKYYCDVECKGELTTGFTLIDMADYYQKPMDQRNLYYLDEVDREGFIKLLMDAIASY